MAFSTAIELVNSVKALYSLPDIYFQLQQVIHDPRFTLQDVAHVIGRDPGLSARLLRIVNSPVYGFQARIDTLARAISIVGLDDLQHLVLATSVVDRFASIPVAWVDMTAYWLRSVRCALLCKLLTEHILALHAERLFVAGLLHDIGSLVLYQVMPEQALRVLRSIDNDRRLLAGFEQAIIGFTHAAIGKELLKQWGLPESLYAIIGNHLQPGNGSVAWAGGLYSQLGLLSIEYL